MNHKAGITLAALILAASTGAFAAENTPGSSGAQSLNAGAAKVPCESGKMGEAQKTPQAENSATNTQPGKMGEEEKTPGSASNSAAKGC